MTVRLSSRPKPLWLTNTLADIPDARFIPPGPAVVAGPLSGWMPNSARSSWLSIAPLRDDYRAAKGTYIYYAGFEVNAQDLGRGMLVGTAWTPQEIVEVQLNKKPVSASIERLPDGQSTRIVIEEGFVEGLNFVYIIVNNGDEGPVAFRAEIEFLRGREQTTRLDRSGPFEPLKLSHAHVAAQSPRGR